MIATYKLHVPSINIQKGDKVRCGDLFTTQYDLEVLYKDWDYIYWSGTVDETFYGTYEKPINQISNFEWVLNIKTDECFRLDMDWIAIDRIRIAKENNKE